MVCFFAFTDTGFKWPFSHFSAPSRLSNSRRHRSQRKNGIGADVTSLQLLAIHIMVYKHRIVVVDGSRGVVKRGEQVRLDVVNFGRVFVDTVKDVLDVG